MFDDYVLLNAKLAIDYAKEKLGRFFEGKDLDCEEIGDGNINYVYRVKSDDKSVILKQGTETLRSSGRALDKARTNIEYEALKNIYNLSKMSPEIYFFDEIMNVIAMEDISDYKNLRYCLINNEIYENLAEEIIKYFEKNYFSTTSIYMDAKQRKEEIKKFTNVDMCDITQDLVMTEPYYNYKNRNIVYKGNEEFVENTLCKNEKVLYNAAIMREKFMNFPQSLIHGDLHTGSIFVNESGIKVIDSEFAFYGPIGYDLGCVIGNLYISYLYNMLKNNDEMVNYLGEVVEKIVDELPQRLYKALLNNQTIPMYTAKFKKKYVKNIMKDGLKYAGMEMIRRSVGDSKVVELTGLENMKEKTKFQRKLVKVGVELLTKKYAFAVE